MATYPSQITLVNSGFETSGGWTSSGVLSFSSSFVHPSNHALLFPAHGSKFLVLNTEPLADPAGTELRAWQDVAVPGGNTSDVDASLLSATVRCQWAMITDGSWGTYRGWIELAFYDADGNLISSNQGSDFSISSSPNTSPTDDVGYYAAWRPQYYTHTVPANTRTIRVTLGGVDSSTSGVCGSIFDDIELELFKTSVIPSVVEQAYTEVVGVIDSAVQVPQVYAESLSVFDSNAQVVQEYGEVLGVFGSNARVYQMYGEAIHSGNTSNANVSQIYAEVLRNVPVAGGSSGGVIFCIMM